MTTTIYPDQSEIALIARTLAIYKKLYAKVASIRINFYKYCVEKCPARGCFKPPVIYFNPSSAKIYDSTISQGSCIMVSQNSRNIQDQAWKLKARGEV